MVLVMANGKAGNPWIEDADSEEYGLFSSALRGVLKELALMIVSDGEGATKVITVRVSGAKDQEEALQIGKTVANSNLVKTAFFGEDANWGRILAAMGRSGVKFNPDSVDIFFDDVMIVHRGLAVGKEAEEQAQSILQKKEICLTIDLKEGHACEKVYTCDLSLDYVKINADYRS